MLIPCIQLSVYYCGHFSRTTRLQGRGGYQAERTQKTIPVELMSKLSQLSSLTKEVYSEIDRPRGMESVGFGRPSTPTGRTQEDGEEEEVSCFTTPVVVLGPPGTEPRKGVSKGRFDRLGSVVYSRSSVEVSMPQQLTPSRVKVTQQKDFVRQKPEVVEVEKRDESGRDRPWTRSGTKMLTQRGTAAKKSPYIEESDSSDEGSLLKPFRVRSLAVSARSEVKAVSAEQQRTDNDSDTTTDSRIPNSTSDEVSEYETAPEVAEEDEEEKLSSSRIKDRLPRLSTPVTITSLSAPEHAKTVDHLKDLLRQSVAPTPISSTTCAPTPCSGLLTVYEDLQRSYGGLRRQPRMASSLKKTAGENALVSWEGVAKSAAGVTNLVARPCSVPVVRLPQELVQKYLRLNGGPREKPSQSLLEPTVVTVCEPESPPSFNLNEMSSPMDCGSPPASLFSSDIDEVYLMSPRAYGRPSVEEAEEGDSDFDLHVLSPPQSFSAGPVSPAEFAEAPFGQGSTGKGRKEESGRDKEKTGTRKVAASPKGTDRVGCSERDLVGF